MAHVLVGRPRSAVVQDFAPAIKDLAAIRVETSSPSRGWFVTMQQGLSAGWAKHAIDHEMYIDTIGMEFQFGRCVMSGTRSGWRRLARSTITRVLVPIRRKRQQPLGPT